MYCTVTQDNIPEDRVIIHMLESCDARHKSTYGRHLLVDLIISRTIELSMESQVEH